MVVGAAGSEPVRREDWGGYVDSHLQDAWYTPPPPKRKPMKQYPWNNEKLVANTPFVTTLLLEGANIQQLFQMWTKWTAAGQSLTGWMSVGLALALWTNYY